MFRPSGSGLRQKLVSLTLKAALLGSWILGIFPFTFDSWTRKLHRSKWLMIYGVLVNAGLVALILCNDTEAESQERMEVFRRNPLAEQINGVHDILSLMMVSFMLFRAYWKSGDIERILNEQMDLNHRHFRHYPLEEWCSFDKFVLYKGLSIVLELASMLLLELGMSPNYNRQLFLGVTSLCLVLLGVLLGVSHFHFAVVYVYRYVWTVNRELLRLVNELAAGRTVEASRVDYLLSLYNRLLDINGRLVKVYDYQMVWVMVNFLSANIMSIYFFIIFVISLKKEIDVKLLTIIPQTLIVNVFDFSLSIAVCDLAERTGKQTSTILKLFNDIENLDEKVARSISDFSLFCSHRRLRFSHCGLFFVNYEMGFRMTITSFMYLLFLIQFDFWNL
ncbi:uncharacterized protein Dana_GF15872 [Drosophila ananassae]|uniref:Gustatory receptor n=1 Tax=Drosophila ananassae TaxID=7217 RepID=B3MKD9_DROAN|nr:gustatory receptor for bitter taste 22e [Drosophila ananassae]EDV32523.1 uncharacterized protein Dana_GF15872 [Drosophila ananassae]